MWKGDQNCEKDEEEATCFTAQEVSKCDEYRSERIFVLKEAIMSDKIFVLHQTSQEF